MPTFKLEEMDDELPYGGDNDMYFRQWRLPSMKPVLDEKLDRDFQEAVTKKEQLQRERSERRQKHSEKFDKKFQALVKQMKEASLKTEEAKKENVPFLRKPTDLELKTARNNLEKEFASPSSTAIMVPFNGRIRPRQNPIFGQQMTSLKSLVLPSTSTANPSIPTTRDPSFSASETVFYPQTHDSFNLDHYNGSRPSFAFSGTNGATSTPVAKNSHFFSAGILEEEGDDSVFENSKYVTAMESPVHPAIRETLEAKEAEEKADEERRKREENAELERVMREKLAIKSAEKAEKDRISLENQDKQAEKIPEKPLNPGRFGRGLTDKLQKSGSTEAVSEAKSIGFSSIFGGRSPQIEQKSLFGHKSPAVPTVSSLFGQKPTEQKPMENTGFKSIFGEKSPETEKKSPENAEFSSIFGAKPPGSSSIFGAKSPGGSSIFGANIVEKPAEIPTETPTETPPKFNFATPSASPSPPAPAPVETPEATPPPETQKIPTRPYILFKNYIGLLKTLLAEKKAYETDSAPQFRDLLKRTITEKVTVFTQRETSKEARDGILEFFKSLLQKKEVEGFTVIGEAPKFQLVTDEDVNYSVYCIVEKYISLTELDEDLAQTISDLISRLSLTVRRIEKVFIVLMFNRSTLLRQNPDECLQKFVELPGAENDDEKAHRKTMEWSHEQALVILFFTVFTKNALISTKGKKMVLSDELLWRYVETSIAHVLDVPKAPFIILQLITTCKPRLHADLDRWADMLEVIELDILPELQEESFRGDEGIVGRLAHMLGVLRA